MYTIVPLARRHALAVFVAGCLCLLQGPLAATIDAAETKSPESGSGEEEQFREVCQKFAQEDSIQATEMDEYMAQCVMDLKMANSPSLDEDGLELLTTPAPETPAGPVPAKKK
jgi:hypothetical protein